MRVSVKRTGQKHFVFLSVKYTKHNRKVFNSTLEIENYTRHTTLEITYLARVSRSSVNPPANTDTYTYTDIQTHTLEPTINVVGHIG